MTYYLVEFIIGMAVDEDVIIIKNLKTSGGTSCTGYITDKEDLDH